MHPETLHLCLQVIRHSRGILSSIEKWLIFMAEQQPEERKTVTR